MFFKKILILLIFSIFFVFLISCEQKKQKINEISLENTTNIINLKKIIELNNQYIANKNDKDEMLFSIGQLALQIKTSIQDFSNNIDYKNICHLRIVKSENFGDFVSYDGYHFFKIINDHPDSDLVDDAEYNLIYIIPEVYNYDDLNDEKNKLELFLKKYPNSNLKDKANKRYNWLIEYLKNGEQSIID